MTQHQKTHSNNNSHKHSICRYVDPLSSCKVALLRGNTSVIHVIWLKSVHGQAVFTPTCAPTCTVFSHWAILGSFTAQECKYQINDVQSCSYSVQLLYSLQATSTLKAILKKTHTKAVRGFLITVHLFIVILELLSSFKKEKTQPHPVLSFIGWITYCFANFFSFPSQNSPSCVKLPCPWMIAAILSWC